MSRRSYQFDKKSISFEPSFPTCSCRDRQNKPSSMPHSLLIWTDIGLYCPAGDFYIDPMCSASNPVGNAVITHAHSDHARRGASRYYCASRGAGLLRARIGRSQAIEGIPYQQRWKLGPVTLSFHSAGHILGSSQVRMEYDGEVWVASGDYKRDSDPSCDPFESVSCDTFITEATFGTPKYVWDKSAQHGIDIWQWWNENSRRGLNSILFGYSLGKTQRILAELAPFADRPILVHSTMTALIQCYQEEGIKLAFTRPLTAHDRPVGDLILAPPSFFNEERSSRFSPFRTAFASGWMTDEYSGPHYDRGFTLSDHADWNDLHRSIDESGAKRVFVMHRNEGALVRSLRSKGIEAHGVEALRPERYARLPQPNLSLF